MSTVLFVLTSVIDKVVHQHLRWIVLQGQFFGPLVALYFLVKKQWIRTEPTFAQISTRRSPTHDLIRIYRTHTPVQNMVPLMDNTQKDIEPGFRRTHTFHRR
eukprot:GEMP01097548.1.p2 GENE.GEMP01097548.1~~GEMP01097548.1.p2  ORF type:complete len:102 (+),score=17.81 GEMP01097548.1:429-734(+)